MSGQTIVSLHQVTEIQLDYRPLVFGGQDDCLVNLRIAGRKGAALTLTLYCNDGPPDLELDAELGKMVKIATPRTSKGDS